MDKINELVKTQESGKLIHGPIFSYDKSSLSLSLKESANTYFYQPTNTTAFISGVEKIAKRLLKPFKEVAYHYTLDPQYYDKSLVNPEGFADEEFALGISDSQSYEDQKEHIKKVYGLNDDELEEVINSETWWQNNALSN
jgi:hypothetical protein